MALKPPISGAAATQIIFILRFIQQGALVLTGFVASYFVYWHNTLRDPVPLPLIGLITACTISYLENCISSGFALANASGNAKSTPNYSLLLKTSTPCTLAMGAGYCAVRQMEFVRKWCEGDNWFRPIRETDGYTLAPAGVEEHQCALTCVLIGAGLVAVVVSLAVSVMALVGSVGEMKGGMGRTRKGYKALDPYEIAEDFDGSTVLDEEEFDKM
ncbi:hypothetical protein N431DRAFT_541444 [Stipitochalara longipes BDJ]|nr:hypothetical protein N431DRAFT_541444 [Stipitochalara longipes BDJ]